MIPDGKYLAKATKSLEWGLTSSGNDQLWVQFKLTQGELKGETIGAYLSFTPKTQDRSIESLRYCGCTFGPTGTDITDLSGIDTNEVQLVIKEEEWKGKIAPKVKWINAAGGGSGIKAEAVMSPSAKEAFKSKMKGLLIATKGSAPAPAQRAPAQRPDDSDIPF